eukprot:g8148.t1
MLVVKKLFTSHDPYYVHKTLGVGALLHFVYRLSLAREHALDMGFGGSLATLACIAWHLALSVSSLIFRITAKRLRAANTAMIWPEFRWHNIIFAARSLAQMLVLWCELRWGATLPLWLHVAVQFLALAAASAASRNYPSGSAIRAGGSVRDLDAPAWFKLFFSNQQFELSAICLVGVRRFALHFQATFIIQLTAFIMTLRRKNLAGHRTVVGIYAFLLVAGFAITVRDLLHTGQLLLVHTIANVAASLRICAGLDKFLVWALASALLYALRAAGAVDDTWTMAALFAASFAAKAWLNGRKAQAQAAETAQKQVKETKRSD